jgi:hypothetical protein
MGRRERKRIHRFEEELQKIKSYELVSGMNEETIPKTVLKMRIRGRQP